MHSPKTWDKLGQLVSAPCDTSGLTASVWFSNTGICYQKLKLWRHINVPIHDSSCSRHHPKTCLAWWRYLGWSSWCKTQKHPSRHNLTINHNVTAQLQPKTKLVWPHNWVEPTTPTTTQTFNAVPDNLWSWFSVCYLILTQLEEIWGKKKVGRFWVTTWKKSI